MSNNRETMTLNLPKREMAVVETMAERAGLSKTQLIRQAIRTYQLIDARLRDGETLTFSGDAGRAAAFIGPLGLGDPS